MDTLATRILTNCRIAVHELTTTTMADQRQVFEVRVLLFIRKKVNQCVHSIHRRYIRALWVHSNTTRLPSIDITPCERRILVLTFVQLGREKLRRHDNSMLRGAWIVVLTGALQSTVHNRPIPVTIAIAAVEHHICVRHLLFIYILRKVRKKVGTSIMYFDVTNLRAFRGFKLAVILMLFADTKVIHIILRRHIHDPRGSVILVILLKCALKIVVHANAVVLHVRKDRDYGHKC